MIRRVHYSSEPLEIERHWVYIHEPFDMKPRGLWYSAPTGTGDGWEDWCNSEAFGLDRLKYATALRVDLSRVLVINAENGLDAFAKEYTVFDRSISFIDWPRVAKDYAGIEIAPYDRSLNFKRRFDNNMLWYYAWDCSSGCVWDLTALEVL